MKSKHANMSRIQIYAPNLTLIDLGGNYIRNVSVVSYFDRFPKLDVVLLMSSNHREIYPVNHGNYYDRDAIIEFIDSFKQ